MSLQNTLPVIGLVDLRIGTSHKYRTFSTLNCMRGQLLQEHPLTETA